MTGTRTQASGLSAQERTELLQLVRHLAEHDIAPRAALLDTDPGLTPDPDPRSAHAADEARAQCWRQLVEAGLDALLPAAEDSAALLAAIEELAVADGGIALAMLLSNLAAVVTELPTDGGRWALVPAGSSVVADGGLLRGQLNCALGAWGADGLVLLTGGRQPMAYRVPSGVGGLSVERDRAQLGLRGAPAARLTLRDVPAAAEPVGDELACLLWAGVAALSRGLARRAYRMALDYAELRWQGGMPIIEHDAVADLVAAMAVRLAVELPVRPSLGQALAAKIALSESALATARDAVQVFGGTGYMCETGVEKLMRDAKYCQLFPEPNWTAAGVLLATARND